MIVSKVAPFDLRWLLRFTESGWTLHSQQSVPTSPVSSPSLAHVVRTGGDDLLDLSDHDDAGQHVLNLLTCEGLR